MHYIICKYADLICGASGICHRVSHLRLPGHNILSGKLLVDSGYLSGVVEVVNRKAGGVSVVCWHCGHELATYEVLSGAVKGQGIAGGSSTGRRCARHRGRYNHWDDCELENCIDSAWKHRWLRLSIDALAGEMFFFYTCCSDVLLVC